jgi:hypothetical protein
LKSIEKQFKIMKKTMKHDETNRKKQGKMMKKREKNNEK